MRIDSLEAFGIDEGILELWRETGHEELLPVQEKAVRECNVLNGNSVLVFSPTSSGKTFVGEMAAAKTARRNERAIYLVPQKALAEEKYNEFRSRYRQFGIRTAISTRDRKEFDADIGRGEFHIAVVVFEKMQGLLVSHPGLLSKVGLVVVDELQMIGDKERGAGLEILLTKMKLAEARPQVIGLSAVLNNCRELARWLGADLCRTDERPVELRKGVLWNGEFHYLEHNSGQRGSETLAAPADNAGRAEILIGQVRDFALRGEQSLVFCRSKRESMQTAAWIAKALNGSPAENALAELAGLEESKGRQVLTQLLESGVAYHNANLGPDERDVIERWFRRGEIGVICATTTLAMGVNLPAQNVFVDTERWDRDQYGHWITLPISQSEYENTAGRAGRLGLADEFGRAIIWTDSQFDARTFFEVFVTGELEDVEPALADVPLEQHVLNLVASGICKTAFEVRDVLLASYTGHRFWRGGEREDEFKKRLREAGTYCLKGGLIERKDARLFATKLGALAAVKGVSAKTAIELAQFAWQHQKQAMDIHLIEVLLCLTRTEDGEAVYLNMSTDEYKSRVYREQFQELLRTLPAVVRQRVMQSEKLEMLGYEEVKRLKKALLLYEWAKAIPTTKVESDFLTFAGGIAGIAAQFGWLAETLSGITDIYDWPAVAVNRLDALCEQLTYGIPEHAVELVSASVPGLGRGRVKKLTQAGLTNLEQVLAAPRDRVETLVTKSVARRLRRRIRQVLRRKRALAERGVRPDQVKGPAAVQEEIEWAPEVPASDDAGMPYQSGLALVLNGRREGRRHLVRIGRRDVWLRPKSFDTLLKLAAAALATDLAWVPALKLGTPDTYHQVIRRLKIDLEAGGVDADELVENSGAKQYRLSVPPGLITIERDTIRTELPEHAGLLNRLESCRRRSA